MIKIEFNTSEIAENEARGLVALLMATHGEGIVPASYTRVGQVEYATGPVVINRMDAPAPIDERAADGYPTPDPDAEPEVTDKISHVAPGTTDSDGIRWDERIHASTKTTNKDGTWTRRRNTPDELFDKVMAELKGATNVYGNTDKGGVGPDGMVAIPTPPAPAAEPTASEAFAAPVPAPPAATPTPAAPAPSGDAPGFVDIMKKVTTLQSAGKLPKAQLDEYLASVGVEGIGKMATASADIRSAFGAILDGLV